MNEIDFGKTAYEVLSGSLGWDWERRVVEVAHRALLPQIVLGKGSVRGPAPSRTAPPNCSLIGRGLPPSPGQLIQATSTAVQAELSGANVGPENRFTYKRKLIEIVYHADNDSIERGEFPTQRDTGLFYQYQLIHNPCKLIRAAELESLLGRWKSEHRRSQGALNDGFVNHWTFDPTVDSRGLAEIKAAFKAIRDEIEEATELHDETRVVQLQEQEERFRAQLALDFLGKRAKNVDPEQERLRDRVRKALANAWTRIGDQMPNFAAHLKCTTFNRHGAWSYRPPTSSGTWLR